MSLLPISRIHMLISQSALLHPTKQSPKEVKPFSVTAFLPFAARSRRNRRLIDQTPTTSESIPSHAPVKLDDPLPFLRLFTSFTFSSTATIIPSLSPNDPLIQNHDIRISSPLSLLHARMQLTVDTIKSKATKLELTSLSPWARRELHTWLDEYAVKKKDITAASWAIQSYWALTRRRAEIWCWCERDFCDLLDDDSKTTSDIQKRSMSQKGKRKAQLRQSGLDLGLGEQDDFKASRAELLPHLGRQAFSFYRAGIRCRIEWTVRMDWTGEAKSRIRVSLGIPESGESSLHINEQLY